MTVTGGTFTYDGQEHGATGSATGAAGENLTSLLTLGEKFKNVPGGTANWSFPGDTNHNTANRLGRDRHHQGRRRRDGDRRDRHLRRPGAWRHGFGDGRRGCEPTSLLTLGDKFTNVPGGTANWSFAGDTNYNDDERLGQPSSSPRPTPSST